MRAATAIDVAREREKGMSMMPMRDAALLLLCCVLRETGEEVGLGLASYWAVMGCILGWLAGGLGKAMHGAGPDEWGWAMYV